MNLKVINEFRSDKINLKEIKQNKFRLNWKEME